MKDSEIKLAKELGISQSTYLDMKEQLSEFIVKKRFLETYGSSHYDKNDLNIRDRAMDFKLELF